jgi:hypothetical protein
MMFGISYVKLIGGAVAALLLLGLIFGLKHYKSLAESRGEQLAIICAATRTASGQPKLDCKQAPQQIQFMGQAIATLKAGIAKQNAAVAGKPLICNGSEQKGVKVGKRVDSKGKNVFTAKTRVRVPLGSPAAEKPDFYVAFRYFPPSARFSHKAVDPAGNHGARRARSASIHRRASLA